jgi:hypothetical protein
MFVDDITHLLIICTSSKATLLGLSRTSPREINLYTTNLAPASTETPMTSIAGTLAGRIFMLGENKQIYELEYAATGGWFGTGGPKAISRTSGALSGWVPSILSSSTNEGVESFVVDAQQNRLYTLGTKGEIEIFDVSGNGWISKGKYTQLQADLRNRGAQEGNRVVVLAPIGAQESRTACMVAICANGEISCSFSVTSADDSRYPSLLLFPFLLVLRLPAYGFPISPNRHYSHTAILLLFRHIPWRSNRELIHPHLQTHNHCSQYRTSICLSGTI